MSAAQISFKLDHIDVNHVDVLSETYRAQFFHSKKIKRMKYVALAASVTALAGLIIWDSYYRKKTPEKCEHGTVEKAKEDLAILNLFGKERQLGGMMIDTIKAGVVLGFASVVLDVFKEVLGAGSSAVKEFFASENICDLQAYQNKQTRLKDLLFKLATLPELSVKRALPDVEDRVFFEIALSDVILTHRTVRHFLEDMLALIKFLVALKHDKDSYEFASVNTNCLIIAAEFNKASDKITSIINHDSKIDSQAFVADFALFCRKFTKFVCEYGVSLYGQDFLQK